VNATKFPVTVHLPVKYLGVDVLARLAEAEQADALRVEIRQLKASRANLVQSHEAQSDALAEARAELQEARERIAALQTELYRSRAEIDSFENACCALTGCTGGTA
jgi:septal ring factor EnvC (AmiA/AmiB activator)